MSVRISSHIPYLCQSGYHHIYRTCVRKDIITYTVLVSGRISSHIPYLCQEGYHHIYRSCISQDIIAIHKSVFKYNKMPFFLLSFLIVCFLLVFACSLVFHCFIFPTPFRFSLLCLSYGNLLIPTVYFMFAI